MSWFKKVDSKDGVLAQMQERRLLPIGVAEFHEWSDRIIASAMLPATKESQKYTLANMLLHMKPTEDVEADAYFIKSLRKAAVNQVADYYRQTIFPEVKARLKAEEDAKEAAKQTQPAADTAPVVVNEVQTNLQRIH